MKQSVIGLDIKLLPQWPSQRPALAELFLPLPGVLVALTYTPVTPGSSYR